MAEETRTILNLEETTLDGVKSNGYIPVSIPNKTYKLAVDSLAGEYNRKEYWITFDSRYGGVKDVSPSFVGTNIVSNASATVMYDISNYSFDRIEHCGSFDTYAVFSDKNLVSNDVHTNKLVHPINNGFNIPSSANVVYFQQKEGNIYFNPPTFIKGRLIDGEQFDKNKKSIKLCTWNIGHFSNGVHSYSDINSTTYTTAKQAYSQLISDINADFYGIEEYSNVFYNDGTHDYYTKNEIFGNNVLVAGDHQKRYTHNVFFANKSCAWSFDGIYTFKCNMPPTKINYTDAVQPYDYRALLFNVWLNGEKIPLMLVHLCYDTEEKQPGNQVNQNQLREIVEYFTGVDKCIVMGDFNTATNLNILEEAGFTLGNGGKYRTEHGYSDYYAIDEIAVKGLTTSDPGSTTGPDESTVHTTLSDHDPFWCTVSNP